MYIVYIIKFRGTLYIKRFSFCKHFYSRHRIILKTSFCNIISDRPPPFKDNYLSSLTFRSTMFV